LITKTYGTWIVLGEIVSTVAPNKLPLPVRPPAPMPQAPCGACTRCIDACPMGALRKDGFDKTRCLSFILQRKAEISPEAKAAIRRVRSVFGCDICQEACPHNANAAMSALPEFAASIQPVFDEHTDLDGRSFAWRGSKILLRNLQISRP
jgi:epoxyqueuosine reductase QueG